MPLCQGDSEMATERQDLPCQCLLDKISEMATERQDLPCQGLLDKTSEMLT